MPSPPSTTIQRDRALDLLRHRGIMRLTDLKAQGIHAATLARLVADGQVHRPARGLYERADGEVGMRHSLAEVAARVPAGVVCLVSALQVHELTLQSPRTIWMAIGEKDRKPRITHVPVRFLHFGKAALTTGVETVVIDGVRVRIFEPAKTVVDCFRYRRVVGLDVALEALRLVLRTRKATPAAIAERARALRVWTVMRPYLESAAADDA